MSDNNFPDIELHDDDMLIKDNDGSFKVLSRGKLIPLDQYPAVVLDRASETVSAETLQKTITTDEPLTRGDILKDDPLDSVGQDREIERFKSLMPAQSGNHDEVKAHEIIKKSGILVMSKDLRRRLVSLVVSRLKNVRKNYDFKKMLVSDIASGGVSLLAHQADILLRLTAEAMQLPFEGFQASVQKSFSGADHKILPPLPKKIEFKSASGSKQSPKPAEMKSSMPSPIRPMSLKEKAELKAGASRPLPVVSEVEILVPPKREIMSSPVEEPFPSSTEVKKETPFDVKKEAEELTQKILADIYSEVTDKDKEQFHKSLSAGSQKKMQEPAVPQLRKKSEMTKPVAELLAGTKQTLQTPSTLSTKLQENTKKESVHASEMNHPFEAIEPISAKEGTEKSNVLKLPAVEDSIVPAIDTTRKVQPEMNEEKKGNASKITEVIYEKSAETISPVSKDADKFKLRSPVTELEYSLTDFRRLASKPKDICQKIYDKIYFLRQESFSNYILAIEAFRRSEVFSQYKTILWECLQGGQSIKEAIAQRQKAKKETLTYEECLSILKLSGRLRFSH
ncbi:MAG: hypothetical protein HY453_00755 [Parcubacteria group bacterium]|nr:hypothetical protein [Parcubacteria group bacterium]